MAGSKGAPLWLLAQQERCTDRTIANRIDRSMAAILAEFLDTETDVERCQANEIGPRGPFILPILRCPLLADADISTRPLR
jgi:hypothetical protein